MKKIKFNEMCKAQLDEPINVGDIIEVTYMSGVKYILMVCIDEENSTPCHSCVFNTNGGHVCDKIVRASFSKYNRSFSPCSALLLNDGKGYKFQHCIYYKQLDSVLEDL